ncbi:cyclin-dependent kinase B2-1-like [Cryptomeria japonica]|uniref:cyclin-dependent kinase B2-1-like n=1 Tax=Cryptomeria japonica TaxID=3369 RepID=UPI0027DA08D3|nr:cyclin-dependent kinase B2-1-like [Cryptomeria japonica]
MPISKKEKKMEVYESLEKIEKIGEGTYGKVYKVKDINTGQIFVLKKLKIENNDEGVSVSTLREISLLRALSNRSYIVRLVSRNLYFLSDVKQDYTDFIIIAEYIKFLADRIVHGSLLPSWRPLNPAIGRETNKEQSG